MSAGGRAARPRPPPPPRSAAPACEVAAAANRRPGTTVRAAAAPANPAATSAPAPASACPDAGNSNSDLAPRQTCRAQTGRRVPMLLPARRLRRRRRENSSVRHRAASGAQDPSANAPGQKTVAALPRDYRLELPDPPHRRSDGAGPACPRLAGGDALGPMALAAVAALAALPHLSDAAQRVEPVQERVEVGPSGWLLPIGTDRADVPWQWAGHE